MQVLTNSSLHQHYLTTFRTADGVLQTKAESIHQTQGTPLTD